MKGVWATAAFAALQLLQPASATTVTTRINTGTYGLTSTAPTFTPGAIPPTIAPTAVLSTTTASPANPVFPADDTFIFSVIPAAGVARRQANNGSFVGPDGLPVEDCRQAAPFSLRNGQAINGGARVSYIRGQRTTAFSVSASAGVITTTFTVEAGFLVWRNAIFFRETVIFCQFTNGTVNSVFDGNLPGGCLEVRLAGRLVSTCPGLAPNSSSPSSSPSGSSPSWSLPSGSSPSESSPPGLSPSSAALLSLLGTLFNPILNVSSSQTRPTNGTTSPTASSSSGSPNFPRLKNSTSPTMSSSPAGPDGTNSTSTPPAPSNCYTSAPTTGYSIVKLSSPTPIINDATFQDPFAYDDAQAFVLLPFGITLYGLTSSNVTVTTNGLFTTSFDTDNEDGDYQPYSLPTLQAPGTTAFPFWFDQVAYGPSTVNGTTDEGIYYQYEFNQTSNTYKLYVEYLLSDYEHDSNPGATPPPLYQYIVQYDSSLAGQMSFYYFQNGNTGTNATIGIQGASSAGAVATVTYSDGASGSVAPGYLINFDTREGNGTVAQTTFSYQSYPAGTFPEGLC